MRNVSEEKGEESEYKNIESNQIKKKSNFKRI